MARTATDVSAALPFAEDSEVKAGEQAADQRQQSAVQRNLRVMRGTR
jgi:hypothetical protein